MRWSADKGWNVHEARDNYEKMVDLRSQSVKEGEAPLTEAEISLKVLGKRLGYVKGLGYGKIPPAGQARATYYGGAVNQLQTTEERNREIMRLRKLLETPHEQSVAQQQLIEAQARKQEDNLGNKRNKIVS